MKSSQSSRKPPLAKSKSYNESSPSVTLPSSKPIAPSIISMSPPSSRAPYNMPRTATPQPSSSSWSNSVVQAGTKKSSTNSGTPISNPNPNSNSNSNSNANPNTNTTSSRHADSSPIRSPPLKASRMTHATTTNSIINKSLFSQNSIPELQFNHNSHCSCGQSCQCTLQSHTKFPTYGAIDEDLLSDQASTFSSGQTQLPPYQTAPNNLHSGVVPHKKSPIGTITIKQKLPYYLPCFSWIPAYQRDYFLRDLIAGLSLASYQIPLSMSFATAVAHVPAVCGLLGLSIAPIVYSIFGTVPQMIVGPEAAVSMIIGQSIEKIVKHNAGVDPVDILIVLTSCSGAILLAFGLLRFGYIDNVLCGSLLKAFISAIGLSLIINSIISILGLSAILDSLPADEHVHSTFEKCMFIFKYIDRYHTGTAFVGFGALLVLIVVKEVKKLFVERKFKKASFFPEILVVVVLSTFMSAYFAFNKRGIKVLGKISVDGFELRLPFTQDLRPWYAELFGVSFMCAILGFFESSTAGKSLGSNGATVSSNRELVALGAVGLTISSFGALPSFGGYARSKLNAINGAETPVAGLFMGLSTLFVTFFMLNYLYYLPICVLNAVTFTVGLSLVQETPKELKFHYRTKGWNELLTFVVTLIASLFYSIEVGVALGCFYSVLRVIKHSTKSRIQILSRVQGTDTFISSDYDDYEQDTDVANNPKVPRLIINGYKEFRKQFIADKKASLSSDHPQMADITSVVLSPTDSVATTSSGLELIDREGCLIVKIPEPLTFTNSSDLKSRLKRLELYGSAKVHPAGFKRDSPSVRHIVFDLHGMTSMDSSAVQTMAEIVESYQKRAINVFFCRVYKSVKLHERLRLSGIEQLLENSKGLQNGIKQQTVPPYYDEILDALKAIDNIETPAVEDMFDIMSCYSSYVFDGV